MKTANINSQDLPDIFDVGIYDGNTASINDAIERYIELGGSEEEEFDAREYFLSVVEAVANKLEKELPGFKCLRWTANMPPFYNYGTDNVSWEVSIPDELTADMESEGDILSYHSAPEWQQICIDQYIQKRVEESGLSLNDIEEIIPSVADYIKQ